MVTFKYLYSRREQWLITMTSKWARSRPKSPALRMFIQPLSRRRSKKTSKLRVTGLCTGNSPGTGEFPAQMASNAENVSIWWRHHVITWYMCAKEGPWEKIYHIDEYLNKQWSYIKYFLYLLIDLECTWIQEEGDMMSTPSMVRIATRLF